MNFTQFWKIYEESKIEVDPEQRFLPNQHNLTIYKHKKLFINLEGCVNTLRGECKDFHARHGVDGDNNTAQSRYQCYYNKVMYNSYGIQDHNIMNNNSFSFSIRILI